ncbi:MAG: hypothetical protein LBJ00_14385 [Planctomycetaceae bacterium]|nr:hypothetical protein [Planctomycetaceae bacterium]
MFKKYRLFIVFILMTLIFSGRVNFSIGEEEKNEKQLSAFPDMTPSELLEKYKRWLDNFVCCEYNFQHSSIVNEASQQIMYRYNGIIRFDLNQKMLFTSCTSSSSLDEYVSSQTSQASVSKITPFLYVTTENSGADSKTDKNGYSVLNYINPSMPFDKLLATHAECEAIMIFGFYNVGSDFVRKSIYDSFKVMKLQSEKQQLGARTVYKIIGEYNSRKYELWLDSVYEYMPIKISSYPLTKSGITGEFSFDFIVQNQKKIKSVFVPNKYQFVMNTEIGVEDKGRKSILRSKTISEGEVSRVVLNPQFSDKDFTITLSIPDGTPAYTQDALQIDHVWFNGKIVPKTDEIALAIARGNHKFIPGPDEPRFWFIALGLIMVFLGGGLKLWAMFKKVTNRNGEGNERI